MLKNVERVVFWIVAAALASAIVLFSWALSLGAVYAVLELIGQYACQTVLCERDIRWFEHSRTGLFIGLALITGSYIQWRWPLELTLNDLVGRHQRTK